MTPSLFWGVFKDYYRDLIDVCAVAFLIYRLLLLAKGTRAFQIIGGLVIFFLIVFVSDKLQLHSLNWLLKQAFPLGPVAVVILFLPELRHALEEFGRPGFWGRSLGLVKSEEMSHMIDAVVSAVTGMSVRRIGALIVFERENGLEDIISNGTIVNAEASAQLLDALFQKGSPLHDGAVIIRQDRIIAAACTLPLTASPKVDAAVHTRHKAALGMSEESDAIVLVISEETGTVSLAVDGKLIRGLREDTLRLRLMQLLQVGDPRSNGLKGTPIGQVATRVSDALMTTARRTSRRTAVRVRRERMRSGRED